MTTALFVLVLSFCVPTNSVVQSCPSRVVDMEPVTLEDCHRRGQQEMQAGGATTYVCRRAS